MVRYSVMSLESCKISGCKQWREMKIQTRDPTPRCMCLLTHFQQEYLTTGPKAAGKGKMSSLETEGIPGCLTLRAYS